MEALLAPEEEVRLERLVHSQVRALLEELHLTLEQVPSAQSELALKLTRAVRILEDFHLAASARDILGDLLRDGRGTREFIGELRIRALLLARALRREVDAASGRLKDRLVSLVVRLVRLIGTSELADAVKVRRCSRRVAGTSRPARDRRSLGPGVVIYGAHFRVRRG